MKNNISHISKILGMANKSRMLHSIVFEEMKKSIYVTPKNCYVHFVYNQDTKSTIFLFKNR
jgi:hypothetical protein